MTTKQTGIRLPELTQRQLSALCESTGMNQSAVMVTAIDRMHKEEIMKTQKHNRLVEFRKWTGQNGINPAGTAEERAQWAEIYNHAETARRLYDDANCAIGAPLEFVRYLNRSATEDEIEDGCLVHSDDDCRRFRIAANAEWKEAERLADLYGFPL